MTTPHPVNTRPLNDNANSLSRNKEAPALVLDHDDLDHVTATVCQ